MTNISVNMTMNVTTTSTNDISLIPFILMGGLLISVPALCCICCFMNVIIRYIYNYGQYTENSIDNTDNQLKLRSIYESLFGSIASPKLTKIIVVVFDYETSNP